MRGDDEKEEEEKLRKVKEGEDAEKEAGEEGGA